MTRFILPIILLGVSVTIFFTFTNPIYKEISKLRTDISSYNEALTNSKALEEERDALTQKNNTIAPDNKARVEKLLPDNIDNIRLILEIGQVASPYGMELRDVQYNSPTSENDETNSTFPGDNQFASEAFPGSAKKDYGVWDLEFSVEGSYDNFINFMKDLENNLRIVDVSSIRFSSEVAPLPDASLDEEDKYQYDIKIRTYWLRN